MVEDERVSQWFDVAQQISTERDRGSPGDVMYDSKRNLAGEYIMRSYLLELILFFTAITYHGTNTYSL